MNNGWTGGQYSLFRALFGVCLAVLLAGLLPRIPTQGFVRGLLPAAGIVLSILFAIGLGDRWDALLLGLICIVIFIHEPRLADPNWLPIGGLLLAHLCLPSAPYGSWAARGRTDPGANWRMPPAVFAAAWIGLALGYGYSGFEAFLDSKAAGAGLLLAWGFRLYTWTALAFIPLALFRPVRPWLWFLMLLLQLLILPAGYEPLGVGLLLLHGFTFDPAWIKPKGVGTETIFYDGHCGLCHRAVRFVLAEDRTGDTFRFAPLDSDTFRAAVSEEERAQLPDSIVVKAAEGAVLTRSTAFLHILRRLGGPWRVLAVLGGLVPQVARDWLYDGVARIRRRLFASPADACPVLPKELRQRFDY